MNHLGAGQTQQNHNKRAQVMVSQLYVPKFYKQK